MSKPVIQMTYPEAVHYYADMMYNDHVGGYNNASEGAASALSILVIDVLGWSSELEDAMWADVEAEFNRICTRKYEQSLVDL